MEEMTTAELNKYLDIIAELISAKAQSVEEAVEIVRNAQIKA